jgi:anti-sigma factor RsiW
MSCREMTHFLGRYLDGDLPAWQRAVFKAHLLLCRDCRRYLRSYKQTIRAARAAYPADQAGPPSELPPVPEELVRAVLAARHARSE